ncbi:hypothetical protein EB75_19310 [Mycobacterium sp. ST-F2]|nr:hypothetical protein EB75_19310 [Mycobacterium sp. ST-F2]
MTVTASVPNPPAPKLVPASHSAVNLSAFSTPFPKPGVLPDITFGVGNAAYNLAQGGIEALLPPLVQALSAAGGLTGLNLTNLISQLPPNLLSQILNVIPIQVKPLLQAVLGPIAPALFGPLIGVLETIGLVDGDGNIRLGGLLGILGIHLDNILDLSDLNVPGVNIVTAGPVFTLLKIAGLDLGWTPGTANAVANAINNTAYLDVNAYTLLHNVVTLAGPLGVALGLLVEPLKPLLTSADVIDVRVPITIGFGLGAFSAGQAYSKVLADLANQPGGVNNAGPILGSLTVLPLVLLNNLGRANGGLLARFYPIGDLLGINFITPDVKAAHSGGIELLSTGLSIGGANLLPVKVDATLEYQPFSDLAAWPNPFSLANNLVAGTLPTYLFRGISTATLTNQLTSQLGQLAGGLLGGNPLAVNIYLTVPTNTLPLMEPMYLTGDVLNMVSFGTLGSPIYKLANALAPAMTSLVNLGYTDVVRNPDGTYSRTLTEAGTPTPFFSFPDVNWQKVPQDIVNSLVAGFKKEFFSNNPTAAPDNAVEALLKLLTGGKLGGVNPLSGLGGVVQGLLNNVLGTLGGLTAGATINSLAAKEGVISSASATDVPSTTPKLAPLSANLSGFTGSKKDDKQSTDGKDKAAEDKAGTESPAEDAKADPKADPKAEDQKADPKADPKAEESGGKHAAEEGTPSTPDSGKKPKHAADEADDATTAGKDQKDKKVDKPAKVTKDKDKDKSEKATTGDGTTKTDAPKTKKQKKAGAAKANAGTGGGSAAS